MWRGTSKKLFNLQETDQRVNNITWGSPGA